MMNSPPRPELRFIETKAHRRFIEMAEACETYRYIGLCFGQPGVGKTRSAKEFANWSDMSQIYWGSELSKDEETRIKKCRAVFYTANVSNTPRQLDSKLARLIEGLGAAKMIMQGKSISEVALRKSEACPLVIVDEADRLNIKSLEHLRDMYDQQGFGLILLGMPGMEKRLSRYPQLYSRVGFVHEFKPLSKDEMRFLFEKQSRKFGVPFQPENFDDTEALAAIMRITRGNFRLIERVCAQMNRIMKINNAKSINLDIVQASRECLVIGNPA